MSRRLTDEEVSRLPLGAARAELMEEIMRQDARRDEAVRSGARGWAAVLGAAAAVVAVATAVVLLPGAGGGDQAGPASAPPSVSSSPDPEQAEEDGQPGNTAPGITPAPPGSRDWVVLDADGWTVSYVSDDSWREVSYTRGRQQLEITLAPADLRDSYVEDRSRIDAPDRDPGTQVRVLGGEGLLWPYSPLDHTTIGEVEGGFYPEVRGSGMDRAAYLRLLRDLVWVDRATFQSTLPEEFVGDQEEREDEITRMLAGMTVPPEALPITSDESDRYQLGADVVGPVVCAWLDRYVEAKASGDAEGVQEATGAMDETRDWPVLQEMRKTGEYPSFVWGYADQVSRGEVPEGYRGTLGCR